MLWVPIPHDFPNHVYSTQLLTHKDGQQGNSDIKVNHLDARYIYFNKFSNLHDGKRPRKIFMTKSKSRGKIISISVQFSSVQLLSRVQLFETPWITARQASLSITNSWSSLRLTSIESVMPSSHLISSSILDTYWPGEFLFQYPIILPFHTVSRQEYWSGLPFPSPVDHILSDLSTMTRPSWVALWAWLDFIELGKAVVLVWLDWLYITINRIII